MRPLIVAEPMLRAPRPEMVAELNGVSSARQRIAQKNSGNTNFKEYMNSQESYLEDGD
jgi:hypothetical protein